MANPDGVIAAIDACLDDYLSEDAMRWAPDAAVPTPRNAMVDHLADWVEERTGFQLMEWQRHYLNTLTPAVEADVRESGYSRGSVVWSGGGWPIIRDDAADVLEWSSTITPAREAIIDAMTTELGSPSPDGLLRISMPDSSESIHRVVGVTPGETLGEYVLTLEPAVTAFSEFAAGLRRAAETALSGFGEAFGPFLSATQAALHSAAYRDNRKHYRRCPTCNPAGYPKGMRLDRSEYRRRRR